jgi:glycosyltransferase involved in cell wall biosynthesis
MEETSGLVSVIMIFLDAAPYLNEAVASVFAQTYGRWELLLVDDGSSDGSSVIASGYAEQHPDKVRYLEHPNHENRGMSASRNLGIVQARGEFVAFLDADDVYLPEKLERQVQILRDNPSAAMAYGGTTHWYSWTGRAEDQGRDQRRTLGVKPDTLVQPPTLPRLFLQRRAQTPGICAVLIRRPVVELVGGFNEQFKGMFEDQVFFYKLLLQYPVFIESGSWDRYRQHPVSHSHLMHQAGQYHPGRQASPAYSTFLSWLEAYLLQHGLGDKALWAALRKEKWLFTAPSLYRLATRVDRVVAYGRAIGRRLGGLAR